MGIPSHFRGLAAIKTTMTATIAAALLLFSSPGWSVNPQVAPDALFRTLSGETLDLSSYKGKPVLLSFWSTSCAICLQEMPKMKLLYRTLKDLGADMISITMPYDPPNLVLEETERQGLPFPVAIDLDGTLMRSFDIPGTPVKILISPEGYISETFLGALDYAKTLNAITSLIPVASSKSVKQ